MAAHTLCLSVAPANMTDAIMCDDACSTSPQICTDKGQGYCVCFWARYMQGESCLWRKQSSLTIPTRSGDTFSILKSALTHHILLQGGL